MEIDIRVAENRLFEIHYPGTNNRTEFTFEATGECTKIVEIIGGSVSNTQQFILDVGERMEERDATRSLSRRFFSAGQLIGSTKYFYQVDKLGSVCEISDNSGVLQSENRFDPFGRRIQIAETIAPDFQFAGYYRHSRSGLYLTLTRAYDAERGRWLTRDPLEESSGSNLYAYVSNAVLAFTDQSGLKPGDAFDRPDDAARDALSFYFARSKADNAEYAGRIYAKGGKFYATTANKGGFNWSNGFVAHNGCTVGDYHTHGNYNTLEGLVTDARHDAHNAEHFGRTDKEQLAELAKRIPGYLGWLGTPSGAFLYYDPRTGLEHPLGRL